MNNILEKSINPEVLRRIHDFTNQDVEPDRYRQLINFIKELDVEVFTFEPQNSREERIDGFLKDNKIFINIAMSIKRRIFTLAHELGHYVLEHNSNIPIPRDMDFNYEKESLYQERLANMFAAEILMPEEQFLDRVEEFRREKKIERIINHDKPSLFRSLADHFQVSEQAAEIRYYTTKK